MSRLRRIEQRDRFFFVTTNLAKGIPHFVPDECALLLDILGQSRAQHGFLLFAYAVMPDHVHLLLDPGPSSLAAVLRDFKSKSALALNKSRHAHGSLWQPRYFDFACRRVRDFWNKMEYIRDNPVRAGLVLRPEDGNGPAQLPRRRAEAGSRRIRLTCPPKGVPCSGPHPGGRGVPQRSRHSKKKPRGWRSALQGAATLRAARKRMRGLPSRRKIPFLQRASARFFQAARPTLFGRARFQGALR